MSNTVLEDQFRKVEHEIKALIGLMHFYKPAVKEAEGFIRRSLHEGVSDLETIYSNYFKSEKDPQLLNQIKRVDPVISKEEVFEQLIIHKIPRI